MMTWLLKSSSVDYLMASLFAILLYLSFRAGINLLYFFSSMLIFLFLLRRPWILLGALGLFLIVFLSVYLQKQIQMKGNFSGTYEIKKITSSGPIIEVNGNMVLLSTKVDYRIFDEIKASGFVETPTNYANASFDYVAYLKTMNIENIVSHPTISLVSHSGDLRAKAAEYISTGPSSYISVAPLLLLGEKTDATKDVYDLAKKLAIVHLFVISGFHISLFYLGINKFLKIIRVDKYFGSWLPLVIIFVYLFFMNFPLSATRAFLLHVILFLNKKVLKGKLNNLTSLSIVMAGMLIYKPHMTSSLSFIFTFLATAVIMIINELNFKTEFRKFLAISIGVYLSVLPISVYINGYLAILGFLFGIVFTPVLMILYSMTILFFPIKHMMDYVYFGFIWFLKIMDKINPLIHFEKPKLFWIQIMYLISLSSFIIWKTWNLFTEKKTTYLKENLKHS